MRFSPGRSVVAHHPSHSSAGTVRRYAPGAVPCCCCSQSYGWRPRIPWVRPSSHWPTCGW
eukprot:12897245-Prorocentrum_lima.AAC.1